MKKFAISLAAGASALFATAAFAAPLSNGMTTLPDGNIEKVRMVCNENGRCWRERGQRRALLSAIHTATLPANAISSAAVTRTVAASASARRE